MYLLDKANQWILKFDPSCPLQWNWHTFFWAELETKSLAPESCFILFCPAPLHYLSLHKSCCYPFQCKSSNALSSPALSSPSLHTTLMLPVPHITLPYLFVLTLCWTSYLLHPWNIDTTEKRHRKIEWRFLGIDKDR